MQISIHDSPVALGVTAATEGADRLRKALDSASTAAIILATGASQFEMLSQLVTAPAIDWSRVHCFHLDEYVGLPATHPASFRRYLRERFVDKLPHPPASFAYIDGEGDGAAECARLAALIDAHPIAVAFIGIGENGHLAFNDPPADFETQAPYLVVELDEACRRQQLGEGWFPTLHDVPRQAISMSIHQILKSKFIVCSVPDDRKAIAVRNAVRGEVTPLCPASKLQEHPDTRLYLDRNSAALID